MAFSIGELCKCDASQICIFCKVLTGVAIAVIAAAVGYFLGKRRSEK